MVSRDTFKLTALQRIQPAEPPALILLVPDGTPLPQRTPASIPAQRRGESSA